MATTSITFRAEEELKKSFEDMAADMGLPMTGLLNAFMKVTVRDGRLPFELVSDEYAHKKMIREKLEEAQRLANSPDAVWHSHEEVFAMLKERFHYDEI
jgi:DNA-damage-inducible protein J